MCVSWSLKPLFQHNTIPADEASSTKSGRQINLNWLFTMILEASSRLCLLILNRQIQRLVWSGAGGSQAGSYTTVSYQQQQQQQQQILPHNTPSQARTTQITYIQLTVKGYLTNERRSSQKYRVYNNNNIQDLYSALSLHKHLYMNIAHTYTSKILYKITDLHNVFV